MHQNKPGKIFAVVQKAGDKKPHEPQQSLCVCTQIKSNLIGNVHLISSRLIFLQQLKYHVIWYNDSVLFSKTGLVCTLLRSREQ